MELKWLHLICRFVCLILSDRDFLIFLFLLSFDKHAVLFFCLFFFFFLGGENTSDLLVMVRPYVLKFSRIIMSSSEILYLKIHSSVCF